MAFPVSGIFRFATFVRNGFCVDDTLGLFLPVRCHIGTYRGRRSAGWRRWQITCAGPAVAA
jgi:hypothetical protein